jgi:hypothetical protein
MLFVGQFLFGALNVALKAPVLIQLATAVSRPIWITLVLLAAVALVVRTQPANEPTGSESALAGQLHPSR